MLSCPYCNVVRRSSAASRIAFCVTPPDLRTWRSSPRLAYEGDPSDRGYPHTEHSSPALCLFSRRRQTEVCWNRIATLTQPITGAACRVALSLDESVLRVPRAPVSPDADRPPLARVPDDTHPTAVCRAANGRITRGRQLRQDASAEPPVDWFAIQPMNGPVAVRGR